jgi:hypothetical protein
MQTLPHRICFGNQHTLHAAALVKPKTLWFTSEDEFAQPPPSPSNCDTLPVFLFLTSCCATNRFNLSFLLSYVMFMNCSCPLIFIVQSKSDKASGLLFEMSSSFQLRQLCHFSSRGLCVGTVFRHVRAGISRIVVSSKSREAINWQE